MRTLLYEYWKVDELPIGHLPFNSIQRALKDEVYMRKFTPSNMMEDLSSGYYSALLYWYPNYLDLLYDHAAEGIDHRVFFRNMNGNILYAFEYLFSELNNKLDRLRSHANRFNHLEETKLKGLK